MGGQLFSLAIEKTNVKENTDLHGRLQAVWFETSERRAQVQTIHCIDFENCSNWVEHTVRVKPAVSSVRQEQHNSVQFDSESPPSVRSPRPAPTSETSRETLML